MAGEPTYDDYDPFAWFYDRYWGNDSQRLLPAYERLVLGDLAPGARVLDLGCGTGHLAQRLAERGLVVLGIEGSDGLLHFAQENAPDVHLARGDFRTFTLDEPVDAVLCVYDSLNHLLDAADLERTCERVHAALRPGGTFVFDMNTVEGHEARWQTSFGIAEDDHAGVFRMTYDETARLGTFAATLFQLQGEHWARTDVALTQRSYEPEEVTAILARTGFADVTATPAEALGIDHVGRRFLRARVRSAP